MSKARPRLQASVFQDLHQYLRRKCELDIFSQLTVRLPHRVPVGDRYTLLDLYVQ